MAEIERAAKDLAAAGVTRFYPSAIADQLDVAPRDVVAALEPLVKQGKLAIRLDLVCEECGRTVKTYAPGERPAMGESIECLGTDEPHYATIDPANIWVSYLITPDLEREAQSEGGPPHPNQPRPWVMRPRAWLPTIDVTPSASSTSTRSRWAMARHSFSNRTTP